MRKFEDFINTNPTQSPDLFDKTHRLSGVFEDTALNGCENLGLQLTQRVQPETTLKDKNGRLIETIMLGSNSYLNLTTHPKVVAAAEEALRKYGYGMGAVSLYCGISDLHKQLEKSISDFYGTEDAVLFSSGYGTNIGVISALCGVGDVIINDSANHASIFDGCRLSSADVKIFPHNNMRGLESVLSKIPPEKKGRLIIVDGVFSMNGDMAPLDKIVELAAKYQARLMVDDAHGLGIVGPTGKGTAEHYHVMDKVDLHVGMLSKVPGGVGGYCACSKEVADYLRLYARTYFFSTALPAPTVGGLLAIFDLLKHDEAGRKRLWENITYLKTALQVAGFNTGDTQSGIIPIIVGDEEILFRFHNELIEKGVYTNIVSYPAVRRKECRVRLCVMKELTRAQMDKALAIIIELGQKYGLIN